jgi:hypothetical protein
MFAVALPEEKYRQWYRYCANAKCPTIERDTLAICQRVRKLALLASSVFSFSCIVSFDIFSDFSS